MRETCFSISANYLNNKLKQKNYSSLGYGCDNNSYENSNVKHNDIIKTSVFQTISLCLNIKVIISIGHINLYNRSKLLHTYMDNLELYS